MKRIASHGSHSSSEFYVQTPTMMSLPTKDNKKTWKHCYLLTFVVVTFPLIYQIRHCYPPSWEDLYYTIPSCGVCYFVCFNAFLYDMMPLTCSLLGRKVTSNCRRWFPYKTTWLTHDNILPSFSDKTCLIMLSCPRNTFFEG